MSKHFDLMPSGSVEQYKLIFAALIMLLYSDAIHVCDAKVLTPLWFSQWARINMLFTRCENHTSNFACDQWRRYVVIARCMMHVHHTVVKKKNPY